MKFGIGRMAAVCLAAAAAIGAGQACAQDTKAVIKVVVPFTAGGVTDQIARGFLERMSKSLSQTMIIENKPGGGSRIGSEMVMRSPPDGTTLLFTNPGYSSLPIADENVKYDPTKALAPISLVGTYSLAVAVSSKVPANTLQEFITYAKKNPGKLSYGSAGNGSGAHFAGEYFMALSGTEMVHIPYKSTSAAILDVASGVLELAFDATAKVYADAGKVKILAVTGDKRDPRIPQVPTAVEAGLKDFVLTSWVGLFAPPGTPPSVIERYSKAANIAIADPKFIQQVQELGVSPGGGSPGTLAKAVQQDVKIFKSIAKSSNISVKD